MTIQLGLTYTINDNKYVCTGESDFMAVFRSHNHDTVPENITIFVGAVIKEPKEEKSSHPTIQ